MQGEFRPYAGLGMRTAYFPLASLLLLALTLVGFGDNLFTDIGQPSNSDPKFVVHGLFCLAWMMVLAAQSFLARAGNLRTHRRLGVAASLIAVGVTLSTLYVFWAVWTGWGEMSPTVRANRLLLPSYVVFVLLGYRNRLRPDWHKRLMLVSTFFMMGPVISRTFHPLAVPFMGGWNESRIEAAFIPYFVLLWIGLFASLFAHDWRSIARVHQVTGWGFLWFGAVWAIVLST